MSTQNKSTPPTHARGTVPGVGSSDWFSLLDFMVIISDPEVYETKQIKGHEIFDTWAKAQWMDGLDDAPDDQLAKFRAAVSNPDNWYGGSGGMPSSYEWDIGGEAGSITFYRLTHLENK